MNTAPVIHRIWVVDGHPVSGSFGAALAADYGAGARAAGHHVRLTGVREVQFDSNPGPLEPDLIFAQDCLQWCDHAAVV